MPRHAAVNMATGSFSPSSSSARARCVINRSDGDRLALVETLDRAHDGGRRDPQAVHPGVDLDEHLQRAREARHLQHPHLVFAVHHDGEAPRRDFGQLIRREESFEQQDPPHVMSGAQRDGRVELDQRQSVGVGQRRQQSHQPVPVGIRLHHGEELRARRELLRAREIRAQRRQAQLGVQRAGHRTLLSESGQEPAGASGTPGGRARFLRLRQSWYKARAAGGTRRLYRAHARVAFRGPRGAPVTPRRTMKSGFYTIMAAQFFSSLADNALLIAAIALLRELQEPGWMTPGLKQSFVLSYVLLAPLVGAFADSMPKGRVMLITNGIKVIGCLMMLFTLHPLAAYAVVGFGAAAYSPAKYGILTELLPPRQLVIANGWIEGTTVASIILGVLTGGALIGPRISTALLGFDLPLIDTGIDTPPEAAIGVIIVLYAIAAVFNWYIPNTGVDHRMVNRNPLFLIREFAHCVSLLWRDKLGQISLATTTLFWGAGATLQFILIDWAAKALGFDLSQASMLQGVVAAGIAAGAVIAARYVSLRGAPRVLPIGVTMGVIVIAMIFVTQVSVAMVLMICIGACAGFFVVPMNALLQHRGHVLMGAGHSIAVQNFNENIGILVMVGLYSLMVRAGLSVSHGHRAVRPLRLRDHGAGDAAPQAQPGAGRPAAPDRGRCARRGAGSETRQRRPHRLTRLRPRSVRCRPSATRSPAGRKARCPPHDPRVGSAARGAR